MRATVTVVAWTEQVTAVYARAMAFRDDRAKVRRQAQAQFERELARLARLYRNCTEAPQRLLAKRIQQYRGQLFCCVADPQVPATKNLAERCLRLVVIARKISGGTRSEQVSAIRAALMSLFGSWAAQEKNLLASCKDLLLAPTCA
jgi:transposase